MENERVTALIIGIEETETGDRMVLIDTIFPRSTLLHGKKPAKSIEVTGELVTVPYVLNEKEYARRLAVAHSKSVNGKRRART